MDLCVFDTLDETFFVHFLIIIKIPFILVRCCVKLYWTGKVPTMPVIVHLLRIIGNMIHHRLRIQLPPS